MGIKTHKMELTKDEIEFLAAYRKKEIVWKSGRHERMQLYCTNEEFLYIKSIRIGKRGAKTAEPKVKSSTSLLLQQIASKYPEEELRALAKGSRIDNDVTVPYVHVAGTKFRFGIMSDWHLGSKYTSEDRVLHAIQSIKDWGAELLIIPGDLTEGMSARPGHVYELSHYGYAEQKNYAIEILRKVGIPIEAISGNHDDWFLKSNGALIIKDIAKEVPNMRFLGNGFGKLFINGVEIHLYHGMDSGASYAISYRIQKIVEAYEAGTKPQILITGHDHKAGYFFPRDVHCILAGCIQNQTPFMQQTRKEAMKGFWLVEVEALNGKVINLIIQFKPFYK